MLRSGSSARFHVRTAVALTALVLLGAAACGQASHAPQANDSVSPRPTSTSSAPTTAWQTLQALPPRTDLGPGAWTEIVNRAGTGPMTLVTRRGLHRFDVEFACDGSGVSQLVAGNGRIVLNVRPSGTRCGPGFSYGAKFRTSGSAQRLRIIVRPSMHWAIQIWAQ